LVKEKVERSWRRSGYLYYEHIHIHYQLWDLLVMAYGKWELFYSDLPLLSFYFIEWGILPEYVNQPGYPKKKNITVYNQTRVVNM
jgi:hypothetical protein